MHAEQDDLMKRLALGAAAGLAGTLVIHALRTVSEKYLPSTMAPIRRDPGEFMVDKAEGMLDYRTREKIPESAETASARGLAFGYGMTFGALYALLRRRAGSAWLDGLCLGLLTWAAGYLGWLPGVGLMPPVWKQRPAQVAAPVARHAAYGLATVAAYDALREHV